MLTRWFAEHGVDLITQDPLDMGDQALHRAATNINCVLPRGENVDVVRFILNHAEFKSGTWHDNILWNTEHYLGPLLANSSDARVIIIPLLRQHRLAPPLMKESMLLRTLVERGRAAPPKMSRRPRRSNKSELKNVLARLFSPDIPLPLFRRVVEFWLGRGLPYKYSRTYDAHAAH